MNLKRHALVLALVGFLAFTTTDAEAAPFDINVIFGGGLTPSQQAIFATAASTWEAFLPEYQPGIVIPSLNIAASGVAIDGPGGILGQAGPNAFTAQGGFLLSTAGIMQFDSADLAALEVAGLLDEVILHEMAHVMGLGTLWVANSVYVNGTGQYTGANALGAYKVEWNPAATFVPVELGGGPGTANGHWDELLLPYLLAGPNFGRPLSDELMTGFLGASAFISNTTVQSFVDIGYSSIPEPGLVVLAVIGLAGVAVRRRRRTT